MVNVPNTDSNKNERQDRHKKRQQKARNWQITLIILLMILAIFACSVIWFIRPFALSIYNPYFLILLIIMLIIFTLILTLFAFGSLRRHRVKTYFQMQFYDETGLSNRYLSYAILLSSTIVVTLVVILGIGWLSSSPILRSSSLSQVANITHADSNNFKNNITPASLDNIAIADQEVAKRLAFIELGQNQEAISKFDIGEEFNSSIYLNQQIYAAPVSYKGFFDWFKQHSQGLPYYTIVNSVSGETKLVSSPKTIKYSHSESGFRNITRYTQARYPKKILAKAQFELDESGNPYYVIPVIKKSIGLFSGDKIEEAIIVDASSGSHQLYYLNDLPNWVDQIIPSDLIKKQIDWYGKYGDGVINAFFDQDGSFESSKEYSYITIEKQLFQYRGLRTLESPDGNVGFLLVNTKNGEMTFYQIATTSNASAMSSAEASVQGLGYRANFPLLLNMNGYPVFMVSLKDPAGFIKMFSFIDAGNYQNIGIGSSLESAWQNYSGHGSNDSSYTFDIETDRETLTINSHLVDIQSVITDGNTYYYLLLEGHKEIFVVPIATDLSIPFKQIGEEIELLYQEKDDFNLVTKVIK